MKKEILINKGQTIKSKITGKTLECYLVTTIYRGDRIVDYEYHFVNNLVKFQTIRHDKLAQMLVKAWIIQ